MPPKKIKGTDSAPVVGKKKPAPKRRRANGYQMPVRVPLDEILTDTAKNQWKIGPSIGTGGFGEIYAANRVGRKSSSFQFVVKIEPHTNGPLFVEMHFYMRNAKLEDIEKFRIIHGWKSLGMPHFIANGSHELDNIKHRFLVIPKYGRDIWSYYLENNRKIPLHTIYRLAIQMIDVLQYIHKCGYIHADIKGANMLLGLDKSDSHQVYLVDFGLASHFTVKDFKPDPKKMHNGTIEYTSRDAHHGVPTRRGDFEILAYNLIHWVGHSLPWEKKTLLSVPAQVHKAKDAFIDNLDESLKSIFNSSDICPEPIKMMFKYVKSMAYNQEPDYSIFRKLFEDGLKRLGKLNTGKLEFTFSANHPTTTKIKLQKHALNTSNKSDDVDDEQLSPVRKIPAKRTRTANVNQDAVFENKLPTIKQTKTRKIRPNNANGNMVDNNDSPKPKKIRKVQTNKYDHVDEDDENEDEIVENEDEIDENEDEIDDQVSSSTNNIVATEKIIPTNVQVHQIPTNAKGSKKKKSYQINFELDFSIDTNMAISIQRKHKSGKKITVSKSASSTTTATTNSNEIMSNTEIVSSKRSSRPDTVHGKAQQNDKAASTRMNRKLTASKSPN